MENHSRRSEELEEERKKAIKPVVRGNVKVKKEPLSRKFSDVFLADSVDNVRSYVFEDVLVPAIKNLVVDMTSNGIDMLINGRAGGGRSSRRGGSQTSYSSYFRGDNRQQSRPRGSSPRERYSYNDIIFETRGDANEVLDIMYEVLEKYHVLSIADYYELAGATDQEQYTDRAYGWFDIGDAHIIRDRDGYRISLPRPESIK